MGGLGDSQRHIGRVFPSHKAALEGVAFVFRPGRVGSSLIVVDCVDIHVGKKIWK